MIMDEEKRVENSSAAMGEEDIDLAAEVDVDEALLVEEALAEESQRHESESSVKAADEDTGAEATQPKDIGDSTSADNAIGDSESQATIAALSEQIHMLKAQIEERSTQYMRIAADFENFRRRTQKEREDMEIQLKCSTLNELLPVIDNFERARSQLDPQTEEGNNVNKSYQSIYKQLVECLKRIGVSPMRPQGKEFDPNLHEAVMREPTDEHPEGTVIEELVRGYFLRDRVLRHAMVKVAAAPEPVVPSEESNEDGADK